MGTNRLTAAPDNPLDWIELIANAMLAYAGIERRRQTARPDWYDHTNYPGGARVYARHRRRGLKSYRFGKSYRSKADDCEAFWATLERRQAPAAAPSSDEQRWARAGLKVVGGAP